MKKLFIAVIVVIATLTSCRCSAELKAYKQYYNATENLLDTLEHYYNWVDGHDPYDYYEAVEKLYKYK